jgi:hypothetical protein
VFTGRDLRATEFRKPSSEYMKVERVYGYRLPPLSVTWTYGQLLATAAFVTLPTGQGINP